MSYSSYFGKYVTKSGNLQNSNANKQYLVMNSEFLNATQLSGFQLIADSPGQINLTVRKRIV